MLKQLSNPSSTGGAGHSYENQVQASFLLMMLIGGRISCFPECQIKKIQLQGRYDGFNTDDIIIYSENKFTGEERKLLGQIKLTVAFAKNKQFIETFEAAWFDFNNSQFIRKRDAIVLITGPMSARDIANVRPILEFARHSENYYDFYSKINSKTKRRKLKVFRQIIEKSSDQPVSNDNFFEFLKHFYIWGFDLDVNSGTLLSLIHTLIKVCDVERSEIWWSHLVQEAANFNKNSGVITFNNISTDILDVFGKTSATAIPEEYIPNRGVEERKELDALPHAADLAVMNLIGSFDEGNIHDIRFISDVCGKEFQNWLESIREALHAQSMPLEYRGGIWEVKDRHIFWKALKSRIFDSHLTSFLNAAVEVLTFIDERSETYGLFTFGERNSYSSQLTKSIGDSLALLGTHTNELEHCSEDSVKRTVRSIIVNVLSEADMRIWKNLNYILPNIAEADPDIYLKLVRGILEKPNNPIGKLYSHKGDFISGVDYMSGFFWALEVLAWYSDNLYRVCDILARLSNLDPDDKQTGRPVNILTSIFLPWFPQTTADVKQRKTILKALIIEFPGLSWEILLRILPRPRQTAMEHSKPKWRDYFPEDWTDSVTKKDYNDFISFAIDTMIELARADFEKTADLIRNLNRIPYYSLEKTIDFLSTESLNFSSPADRRNIWELLIDFVNNHKRFPDAKWSLDDRTLEKIDEIAKNMVPENPIDLNARLFTNKEFDLYTRVGNWEEQQLELEDRRYKAVKEVIELGGYNSILELIEMVESPYTVGNALGRIESSELDDYFFPSMLDSKDNRYADLVRGYIWKSSYDKGWDWVDHLEKSEWTKVQIAKFLSCLPFVQETWNRVKNWMGKHEKEYWKRALVNPYTTKDDLTPAINSLIKYGRADASLECIYRMIDNDEDIETELIVKTLLESADKIQLSNQMEALHLEKIIKYVQQNSKVDPTDVSKVEWAYLSLLKQSRTAKPVHLENQIAFDADFFCDLIRTAYGSRKEIVSDETIYVEYDSKVGMSIELLNTWMTVPGRESDDTFSKNDFLSWMNTVKKSLEDPDLLIKAYWIIGGVLINSPADSDGLWIDHAIAKTLNADYGDSLRDAYCTKIYNSRGVHIVDPTGAPELELADRYFRQAQDLESNGYFRFANELKKLSNKYKSEANKNKERKL